MAMSRSRWTRGSNRPSLPYSCWCRAGAERPCKEDGTRRHGAHRRRQSPGHRCPRILRRHGRRPRVAARLDPRRARASVAALHAHHSTPARSPGQPAAATLVELGTNIRKAAAVPVLHCSSFPPDPGYTEYLRCPLADAVFRRMVLWRHPLHHRSMGVARPERRRALERQAAEEESPFAGHAGVARTRPGLDLHSRDSRFRLGCTQNGSGGDSEHRWSARWWVRSPSILLSGSSW
jgi:hypothetical protein